MFGKKKLKKKICAGVDVGSYSIKIIEVVADQGKHILTKFAVRKIPSESESTNTLKAALEEANLSTKDIRVSLSGPSAIVRFINMPEMNPQDLKNSLKYEAEKYIPFGIDEVNIDSCILGKSIEEKGQMRVLLAAAKKDIVLEKINMFEQMGFNVSLFDLSAFSVFNAFLISEEKLPKDKNVAILHLGHRYSNIVIAKGDEPYFTRDIQIGGEEISRLVSKQLGIRQDDVFETPEGKEVPPEMGEVLRNALSKLGEEIRLSFGYYENQYGSSIEQIYLSGGLANVPGVSGYFEENMGIQPIAWDPFRNFDVDSKMRKNLDAVTWTQMRSALAVACGLVVR